MEEKDLNKNWHERKPGKSNLNVSTYLLRNDVNSVISTFKMCQMSLNHIRCRIILIQRLYNTQKCHTVPNMTQDGYLNLPAEHAPKYILVKSLMLKKAFFYFNFGTKKTRWPCI